VALNGIGLRLVGGKKSYDKHAAQTFSYNPKSLFKQGDGAALVAKDLYYWSRLEHSRWEGGETYEPWMPDPSDPQRLNHRYESSFGFDVSDPHRLTHLREILPAPSYEFVLQKDIPLAYWILGDHSNTSAMVDQVSNNRTPGLYYGNIIKDVLPGPIVNDPNSVVAFDGSTAYAATGPNLIPFAGNVTPTIAWSVEAWVNPAAFPANEVMVLVGSELLAGTGYQAVIEGDIPSWYFRFEEIAGTTAVHDSTFGTDMAIIGGVTINQAGSPATGKSYSFDGATGSVVYGTETAFTRPISLEAWVNPTAYGTGGVDFAPGGGIVISTGTYAFDGVQMFIANNGHLKVRTHRGLGSGDVLIYDSGTIIGLNAWSHIVVTIAAPVGGNSAITFYINGNQITGSFSTPDGDGNLGSTNWIGNAISQTAPPANANSGFIGRIDEPAVYNSVLMPTQVLNHYTSGGSGIPGGGFAMGIGNGTGGAGNHFVAYLPTVGWVDSGYVLPGEGAPAGSWYAWWTRGITGIPPVTSSSSPLAYQRGAPAPVGQSSGAGGGTLIPPPVNTGGFTGGASISTVQGTWYHMVMTYDGVSIRFYTNGVLRGTVAAIPISVASYAVIGGTASQSATRVTNAQKFFTGLLSHVAVYSTTLSLAQIQAHYNQGTGAATATALTANQSYARFIETYDGKLYINQQNTNMIYSTDGGASWTSVTIPGGDVSNIGAIWTKGAKLYVATANNVYLGDNTGFTLINGANPALVGVTAGIFYSGQIYAGIGTALYYIDPATGIKTLLYDTVDFTIKFIEAFQGKIWFGGTNGRATRVWTWTNNILPPSPANGVGAQIQDGTIPYGFIAKSSIVYLNTLFIGGTIAGDTTSEGQGAVYYVTASGQLGQLCVLGPLIKDIRGTGLDYGVLSLWGANNMLWMGYSYNTGMARYDFGPGAFSSHVTIYNTKGVNGKVVLAIAYKDGKAVLATKDGYVWKESTNKVTLAWLQESEFHELPFLPKLIDGVEGRHSGLLDGQRVQIEFSYDQGKTWSFAGENAALATEQFNFLQDGVTPTHWMSRVLSFRGSDTLQAAEINNWSIRFAPQNSPKHEWLLDLYLPVIQKSPTGGLLTDAGAKLLAQLWQSRELGVRVDFVDRDGQKYKVLVLDIHENELSQTPVKINAQQLHLASTMVVELLEVQKL
jgi:hypothetical protein